MTEPGFTIWSKLGLHDWARVYVKSLSNSNQHDVRFSEDTQADKTTSSFIPDYSFYLTIG